MVKKGANLSGPLFQILFPDAFFARVSELFPSRVVRYTSGGRQTDPFKQITEPGIRTQAVELDGDAKSRKIFVPHLESLLQPIERLVFFAERGVDDRHPIGWYVAILHPELQFIDYRLG